VRSAADKRAAERESYLTARDLKESLGLHDYMQAQAAAGSAEAMVSAEAGL
jgi:hypothetical protein